MECEHNFKERMRKLRNFCNKFSNFKIINKFDTNLGKGILSVMALNKMTNEPVAFAEVSVYYFIIRGLYGEQGNANLVARHITDENGKIPLIELPVIDRTKNPVQYFITVQHFRYHRVNLMNVQIYPNITTSYNVFLMPLTFSPPDYEFIITPELR